MLVVVVYLVFVYMWCVHVVCVCGNVCVCGDICAYGDVCVHGCVFLCLVICVYMWYVYMGLWCVCMMVILWWQ